MKLSRLAQFQAPAPRPQPQAPAPQVQEAAPASMTVRNNKVIADSLAQSAQKLGLNSSTLMTDKVGSAEAWMISCKGKEGLNGPDVEIVFHVPMIGAMEGSVMVGQEKGAADRIMRKIVSGAVKDGGIAALQIGRTTDPVLCGNPRTYAGIAPQTKGENNGIA